MKEQDQKPEPRLLRQEQDKITSQNRFRPLTPDKDTSEEEYQTDETESPVESLQTLNRRYQEERMAAAVVRQNQNQNVLNPKEIRINFQRNFPDYRAKQDLSSRMSSCTSPSTRRYTMMTTRRSSSPYPS